MTHFWRRTSHPATFWVAFVLLNFLLLVSCRKYSDEIGYDLIPNTGLYDAFVVDSFSIKTSTIKSDSVRVDSLKSALVGAINDPLLGVTSVNLYTQCLLQEINIDFGTAPKLDSIVLSLAIDQNYASYGKASSTVEFDIYRMDELLLRSNRYYSNYTPKLGSKIGNWEGKMNASDTTRYYDKKVLKAEKGLIRISLDKSFGEQFFTANSYGSNESFLNFLKGVAIIPNASKLAPGEGRMAPIFLNSLSSKLVLYYNDSLQKEFVISDQSERIMKYISVNKASAVTNQLNNPGKHYDETFIQSTGYVKTKIEIPGLLDIVKEGNKVLINEASLTFTIKDGTATTDFPAPSRLLLFQAPKNKNSTADSLIIDLIDAVAPPSASWVGYTNYGGNLSADGKTYTFRFNRHLQQMVDDFVNTGVNNNRGFYLVIPSDNPITPSRVVLDTRNGMSMQNIKLKVTYTKL